MRGLLLLACLGLVGCRCDNRVHALFGEGRFVPEEGVTVSGDEATLDFGRVPFGENRELPVAVQNSGAGTLEISGAEGNTGPFVLLGELPLTLQATEAHRFTVRFTPPLEDEGLLSSSYAQRIVLPLDGTESPVSLVLNVRGEGYTLDNCVSVMPSMVDFGEVQLGCSESRTVGITNICTRDDVHLDAMTLSGDGFSLESPLEAGGRPLVVVQTQPFQVRFDATDAGLVTGELQFGVTQGRFVTSRVVGLEAMAVPRARMMDSFVVRHAVDILIVGPISQEQPLPPQYANSIRGLMDEFSASQVDFHLGFIRSVARDTWNRGPEQLGELVLPDAGAPRFFDATTPEYVALEAMWNARQRNSFSGVGQLEYPRAFESARRAMTPPFVDDANAGFFRPGVHLTVVTVVDGNDFSTTEPVEWTDAGEPLPVSFYFDAFSAVHPRLTVSSVCMLTYPICGTTGVNSIPSPTRFLEMVDLTGGVVVDGCSTDWDVQLVANIRDSWVDEARTFELRQAVDGNFPMEVLVDGQPLPSGDWSYDADAGTVTLTQLPPDGVHVDVLYTTPCE